jgi:hypothetical protein
MLRLLFRAAGYLALVAAVTVFGGLIGFHHAGDLGAAIGGAGAFILACLAAAKMNSLEVANSH